MTDLAIWMPHLEKCGSHVMIINYREIPFSAMSPSCLTPAGTHTHFLTHLHTLTVIVFSAGQPARGTDRQTGTYWYRNPTWTVVTHSIHRSGHADMHTLFCHGCVFCCVLSVDIATAACFFLCSFHLKIIHTTRICLQNITVSEWSNLQLADMTEIAYFLRWWWTLNSGYAMTLWR